MVHPSAIPLWNRGCYVSIGCPHGNEVLRTGTASPRPDPDGPVRPTGADAIQEVYACRPTRTPGPYRSRPRSPTTFRTSSSPGTGAVPSTRFGTAVPAATD